MSSYIYLYCDRVIYWHPYSAFYKPVAGIPLVTCYMINDAEPILLEEMVRQKNYGFDLRKGFFILENDALPIWSDRENVIKKIMIAERFHDLANTHKLHYTDNSVGQSLTDILVMDEIREFRRTNSLENCLILNSLAETSEASLTPEALAAKLWLRYESYRTIIASLNRLEFDLWQLLNENHFDEANELLVRGFEKMGV